MRPKHSINTFWNIWQTDKIVDFKLFSKHYEGVKITCNNQITYDSPKKREASLIKSNNHTWFKNIFPIFCILWKTSKIGLYIKKTKRCADWLIFHTFDKMSFWYFSYFSCQNQILKSSCYISALTFYNTWAWTSLIWSARHKEDRGNIPSN